MAEVKLLGTRGSVPVSGTDFSLYGGATSAYMLQAEGEVLFLDAGTGIRNVQPEDVRGDPIHILLTHTHIDHILGLPFFLLEHCIGKTVEIWGRSRRGESVEEQLSHLFSLPLWPAPLRAYPGVEYRFREVPEEAFAIGSFHIRAMESNHPGGSLVYRVDVSGKSMVLATDFEHGEEASAALAEFSAGADLILYDGQYTSENYEKHRNFGHSTPEEGMRLAHEAGASRLMIVHHDPGQTDRMLSAREKAAGQENVSFAREKETVIL